MMWFPSVILSLWMVLNRNISPTLRPTFLRNLGRAYAVVKKQYRNTDLKKNVIGLNLVEIHSLDSVYQKFTWPMWECIESMHNGAILIKKARLIKQKVLSLHREHKQWPFTYVLDKSS